LFRGESAPVLLKLALAILTIPRGESRGGEGLLLRGYRVRKVSRTRLSGRENAEERRTRGIKINRAPGSGDRPLSITIDTVGASGIDA